MPVGFGGRPLLIIHILMSDMDTEVIYERSKSCLPAIASSDEAGGPKQARLHIGTLKPERQQESSHHKGPKDTKKKLTIYISFYSLFHD